MFFLCFAVSGVVFAMESISELAETTMESFLQVRMVCSKYDTDQESLQEIQNYVDNVYNPIKDKLNYQEQMILDNLIIMERFNYLKNDPKEGSETAKRELLSQLKLNTSYIDKERDLSPWLYTTSGNVIGCYMSFYPIPVAIKYGMRQKRYFETACRLDENFSYGEAHLAQWLIVAPRIYGGDEDRAGELFRSALENAHTDGEKYYCNIYLSQYYYEIGQYDKVSLYLNEAEKYFPQSNYIVKIREMNKKGSSIFSYKEAKEYKAKSKRGENQ